MSADRMPPHDVGAELALIGACLLSAEATRDAMALAVPEDFYKPAHQYVWDAIGTLWRRGDPVDAVTVTGILREHDYDGDLTLLIDAVAQVPAISRAKVYAESVVRCSRLRAAIMAASEIMDSAYDAGADPDNVLGLIGTLSQDRRLLPRHVEIPDTLSTVADFLEWFSKQHPDAESEWIIPGMLRAKHRVLFVAPEGSSKSTIMRQMGTLVSNGLHPFNSGMKIRERVVLLIDCENPPDVIEEQISLIDEVTRLPMSQSGNLWLWRADQGLDLRGSRADQAKFEAVLAKVRPELVIIGPVYKIYTNTGSGGPDLEHSANELHRFLDSCRARFGFALLMEHHAAKGASGSRDLSPFGTVAWMRWPEFGVKLTPKDLDQHRHPHLIDIGRFRGDRVGKGITWPETLHRDDAASMLPWVGRYPDWTYRDPPTNEEPEPPPPPVDTDW